MQCRPPVCPPNSDARKEKAGRFFFENNCEEFACKSATGRGREATKTERQTARVLPAQNKRERVPASKRILHGGGSCGHGHTCCFISPTEFDMWVERSDRSPARIMKKRKRRGKRGTDSERSGPDFVTAD